MTSLLIVEHEPLIREQLRKLLIRKGWEVAEASSVREAKVKLAERSFDVVLADVLLPPGPNGTTLLGHCGEARVVMLSSHGTLDSAVDAMRQGAVDYICKPYENNDLLARLVRAAPPKHTAAVEGILGESPAIGAIRDEVRRVATTDLSVLVVGESGTGKELVARAVHRQSARRTGPFVAFSCATFTEALIDGELFGHEKDAYTGATEARPGLFESANGGTVFLDEVGELPAWAQVRLLRVLQEREVLRVGATKARRIDVRVVAATNRDLPAMVHERTFREDLFYRLCVFEIRVPPLRDRGDDLFLLAGHVLEQACARQGRSLVTLSEGARRAMRAHLWPGNVRELESTLRSALVRCDGREIDASLLRLGGGMPSQPARSVAVDLSIKAYRRRYILENKDRLSKAQLANNLGISRTTLWRLWVDLGLPPPSK